MLIVPEFETVCERLAPLLPKVYSAVDHGTSKVCEFFEKEAAGIVDCYLAPALVRYFALRELKKLDPNGKGEDDVALDNIPNNGIYIHCGGYHIRILKSSSGGPPYPGRSISRQEFYQQQIPFKFYEEGVNLLILWDVNPPYNLSTLYMACPKDSATYREPIPLHWHLQIPDKFLFGIEAETSSEEIQDLQISFKEPDLREGEMEK
jgi:hypothetical protein